MRVFVSSLMRGEFAEFRDAAVNAIEALDCEPVRAEDYSASPSSPQVACLAGVRSCDVVVLIMGSEYGDVQESGLSATHEEYREARDASRHVLAFVEGGIDPAGEQAAFIEEVRDWAQGQNTDSFHGAAELQKKVARGLNRLLRAEAAAPMDDDELAGRASALLPEHSWSGRPLLAVAVAGGPNCSVVRPGQLEGEEILRFLQAEAHGGPHPILSYSSPTETSVRGDTVCLDQRDTGAAVSLSETGSIVAVQPAGELDRQAAAVPAIIVEDVVSRICGALRLAGRILDHVDPQHRISSVAVAAGALGAGFMPWRTRDEHDRSPQSATMSIHGHDRAEALLSPPTRTRASLQRDAEHMAEDLAVRLRRAAGESPYL